MRIDLFMSYTADDFLLADALAWQLEAAGHRVVMDGGQIAIGADATSALRRRPTHTTIAVLSPSYLTVLAEQPAAAEMVSMQAKGDAPALVAVRVRECPPDGLLPDVPVLDLVGVDDATALTTRLRDLPQTPPMQSTAPSMPTLDAPVPAAPAHGLHEVPNHSGMPKSGHGAYRNRVFVSYSHVDKRWLDRMLVFLKPWEKAGVVDVWSDKMLQPGDDWKTEIEQALESASVAVLLVSADFLASEFVVKHELPPLLQAARTNGTRILPVIVGPSSFQEIPSLSRFHAVNPPERPLLAMTRLQRDTLFLEIAQKVMEAVGRPPDH